MNHGQSGPHNPPHLTSLAVTVRRGEFWLAGDSQRESDGTRQVAPAFVQWEAPAEGLPPQMIFVHGGGGQSTDWLGYGPAQGWARHAVRRGWAAYLLDRPGHGRSTYDENRMGSRTPVPTYEQAAALFLGDDSCWPWNRDAPRDNLPPRAFSGPIDALVASADGMPTNTAWMQRQDAARLTDLLDVIGPCVLVTHSAGAAAGWIAALSRPGLVRAVISVEPLGPPDRDMGERGALTYGVAATPLPPLKPGTPPPSVYVLTGSGSGRVDIDAKTTDRLSTLGLSATQIILSEHGLPGHGHGLVFEAGNDRVFDLVLKTLADIAITATSTDRIAT